MVDKNRRGFLAGLAALGGAASLARSETPEAEKLSDHAQVILEQVWLVLERIRDAAEPLDGPPAWNRVELEHDKHGYTAEFWVDNVTRRGPLVCMWPEFTWAYLPRHFGEVARVLGCPLVERRAKPLTDDPFCF